MWVLLSLWPNGSSPSIYQALEWALCYIKSWKDIEWTVTLKDQDHGECHEGPPPGSSPISLSSSIQCLGFTCAYHNALQIWAQRHHYIRKKLEIAANLRLTERSFQEAIFEDFLCLMKHISQDFSLPFFYLFFHYHFFLSVFCRAFHIKVATGNKTKAAWNQ